jgi:acetoacetyl-CoA synthetase
MSNSFSTHLCQGIWRQGDFIVANPLTKGLMILGRRFVSSPVPSAIINFALRTVSDGVLNPSGVRFGSGEIYAALEAFSEFINDSLCVGQHRPQDKDERVLLFLKMHAGRKLDANLIQRIKTAIRTGLSARHVPSFIFEIEEIPVSEQQNDKSLQCFIVQPSVHCQR